MNISCQNCGALQAKPGIGWCQECLNELHGELLAGCTGKLDAFSGNIIDDEWEETDADIKGMVEELSKAHQKQKEGCNARQKEEKDQGTDHA